jgi:hypothetical protein
MMRTKIGKLLLFVACMAAAAVSGWVLATVRAGELQQVGSVPQGFTYQGELQSDSGPVSGQYDFQFSLWDDAGAGQQVGNIVQRSGLEVSNGRFTTTLDFGDVFDGRQLYLQIAVRASGSSGPYTTLQPRQRLSATPYATYAGTVHWSGIRELPAGFADGIDNDTIYKAGDGLRLNGSQLDVVGMPLPFHEDHIVDSTAGGGPHNSMIIGRDGLPLISYHDAENGDLKVAHCADLTCSQATLTTLDSEAVTGKYTSITLGRDGNGLISYYDETNSRLKLAHCHNLACTNATLTVVDDGGNVGQYSSVTTSSSGYAFISYYDAGSDNLKSAACQNLDCTDPTIDVVDESGDVGQYTSVTRSASGDAYISYYDATNGDLKLARCQQMDCSVAETVLVDGDGSSGGSEHDAGKHSSITITPNGFPLIAYTKSLVSISNPAQVRVAHCNNESCLSSAVDVIISTTEFEWLGVSLTMSRDGLGLITFTSPTTSQLYTARCSNTLCSSQTVVTDTALAGASDTSVTVGVDGLPLISYSVPAEGELRAIHCSELECAPYLRHR